MLLPIGTKSSGWFTAAQSGNIETLKNLDNMVDVNTRDFDGRTALICASLLNQEEVIQFLLTLPDININAASKNGQTALICAIINKHENIAKILIQNSIVDLNIKDMYGKTALMYAVFHGQINIVKILLQATARIDSPKTLDINAQDNNGDSAFVVAVGNGDQEMVKILLQIPDINIDQQNNEGITALMFAACHNYETIAQLTMQKPNIKVNAQDNKGNTALWFACFSGYEHMVKLLLQVPNIDVNIQTKDGSTALSVAAAKGHKNIVELLLAVPGINIEAQDISGNGALDYAVAHKCTEIEKLIREKITQLTSEALLAIQHDDAETLESIVKQIEIQEDVIGNTFFHWAFTQNAFKCILYFLRNEKDPRDLFDSNDKGIYPTDLINPTSEPFKLVLNLAYGMPVDIEQTKDTITGAKSEPVAIKLCHICATEAVTRCSKCKKVYYCCAEHQKTDWDVHKFNCAY